jgi:hypothetical protein
VPEPDAIVLVVDDEVLVLANMSSTSSLNSLSLGAGLACSTSRRLPKKSDLSSRTRVVCR